MDRRMLRDDHWARIEHLLPGKASDRGVTAKDNRRFLEAVLWVMRTEIPWRDLPAEYGHWHRTYVRFSRWREKGVFERVAQAFVCDANRAFFRPVRSPISSTPPRLSNTCRHRPSLQTRATMRTTLSPRSRQRCSGGYPSPIQSTDSSQLRSPSLSRPQSGRTILCSHQTLQTYRHPLRQAIHIFPVVHSSGVRLRQAGLIDNRP